MIDTLILREASGNIDNTFYIKTSTAAIPVESYKTSDLYEIGENSVSLFITFSLCIGYLRFIYNIVSEKEARITENMRNMGMSMAQHYLSWIIWTDFTYLMASVPWVILLKVLYFKSVNLFVLWSLFILPAFALVSIGFFISAFFTRAKPGVLAGLVIFFALYGASIGMNTIKNITPFTIFIFTLSPLAGIEKVSKMLLIVEANYAGFGIATIFD